MISRNFADDLPELTGLIGGQFRVVE